MSINVILFICCVIHKVTSIKNTNFIRIQEDRNHKGMCHIYGDPHIILFPQQSGEFQNQYWCKLSGEYDVVRNDYIQLTVITKNQNWLINEFIIKFFKDDKIICTITVDEQQCDRREIQITRPSLTQMDILYITPGLHISVVPHEYQIQWYDISVRMPYELIRQSNGLCITPLINNCEIENNNNNINPFFEQICEQYLAASFQASIELGLLNDLERYNNALIACIHDYETTHNKNFGASMINMIIKHNINSEQFTDEQFELQTIRSINIIEKAIINATIQTDIFLNTTTVTPLMTTITRASSIQTTVLSNLASTTTSDCLIMRKSNYIIFIYHLIILSIYINLT